MKRPKHKYLFLPMSCFLFPVLYKTIQGLDILVFGDNILFLSIAIFRQNTNVA